MDTLLKQVNTENAIELYLSALKLNLTQLSVSEHSAASADAVLLLTLAGPLFDGGQQQRPVAAQEPACVPRSAQSA
jgi:hypothetical protein